MGSGALGVSDRPQITTFDPSATAKTRRINTRTRTGHEHTDKLTDRDWDGCMGLTLSLRSKHTKHATSMQRRAAEPGP